MEQIFRNYSTFILIQGVQAMKLIKCRLQNSAHFSNVIYFMPQAFELQNPLSYHAGRNEDMFCETKKLPNSIYNRQQFNPIMYSKQLPIPKIEC